MTDESTEDIDTIEIDLVDLTVTIVAAYVTKNTLPPRDLAGLVTTVHAALAGLGDTVDQAPAEIEVQKLTPAQIRKSITPEALISFIDGKPYTMLRRHLSAHGFDPHTYRRRYGLPQDYPMTAPTYSERRSAMAKTIGLGGNYRGSAGQTGVVE